MKKFVIKKIIFSLFVSSLYFSAFSQVTPIDFYGIVAPEADANMTGMTSDLYFAQLSDMGGIRVSDRRSSGFSSRYVENGSPVFDGTDTSFYAVINKGKNKGTWVCTLHLANPASSSDISYSREFDSYYKIMTDAKQTIQALFEQKDSPDSKVADTQSVAENVSVKRVSSEAVAGTWYGEDYIEKIVILKGGRGFVIFKNGASMTISVAVSETNNNVTITQSGPSNASYFPELPREAALTLATNASPLSWTLSLNSNNTLSGKKSTYAIKDGNSVQITTDVVWSRSN